MQIEEAQISDLRFSEYNPRRLTAEQEASLKQSLTDEEILETAKKMIKKDEDGNSTVWRFSRDQNYVHPTQKPVALVSRAIFNSCKSKGVVLDLFGGSGSTLIAAEKADRGAYLMEKDPGFCDVIVKRYVKFCEENGREWSVLLNNVDISEQYATKKDGEKSE